MKRKRLKDGETNKALLVDSAVKRAHAHERAFVAEVAGMNADYAVYIATKHGRTWKYVREDDGWTQTAPTGIARRLSAEQLLSHLLPPLSGDQPNLSVRVERRPEKKGWGAQRLPRLKQSRRITRTESTNP